MHKYTYTNSQLNTWSECKKKYYFKYVKKINIPEKPAAYELGRNVHSLINYYLRGHDIAIIEKNLDTETKTHWFALKNYSLLKNKVLKSEWEFNSKIGETKYWLNGRVDAIFGDEKNNKYIIADWKTGQNIPKNPESSLQSASYLYSVFRAQKDLKLSINYEDLSFLYIKTPEC
ncbi:MAG: PD-(D/E)XK nuclease family protein, partial [Candidatus Gastranaerophilaceae bacterium]